MPSNVLEITDRRSQVDVAETSNTLSIVAPNAITITEVEDLITVTDSRPQVLVSSPGPQGARGINWRGTWDASNSYVRADAVEYGGSAYFCLVALGGGAITTPNSDTEHWDLMAAKGATGLIWRGEYDNTASYAVLDAVHQLGNLWVCTLASTGNVPPSTFNGTSSYWEIGVTKAVTWTGAWDASTSYFSNDIVTHDGSVFRAARPSTARTPPHFYNASSDLYWDQFAAGNDFWSGDWDSGTTYYLNDLVRSEGNIWRATASSQNIQPPTDPAGASSYWAIVVTKGDQGDEGMNWKGDWSSATAYVIDDTVFYSGTSWICLVAHTDSAPTALNSNWGEVAQKGDTGPTGGTGATGAAGPPGATGGSIGGGFTYDDDTSGGSASDGVLRLNNADLTLATRAFAANGDNDGTDINDYMMLFDESTSPNKGTMLISKYDDNSKFASYLITDVVQEVGYVRFSITFVASESTTPFTDADTVSMGLVRTGDLGVRWLGVWASGTAYVKGDGVLHGGSAYVATTSNTGQEPPNGTYWQLFAAGGAAGGSGVVGSGYKFDDGTASDPSAGHIRLNSDAGYNAVTAVYVNITDIDGNNVTEFLQWPGGSDAPLPGYLKIASTNDVTKFLGYEITNVVVGSGVVAFGVQNHTSGGSALVDEENLTIALSRTGDMGLTWRGEWLTGTDYVVRDVVLYQSHTYIAIDENDASPPSHTSADWDQMVRGVRWLSANWSALTTYRKNDALSHDGAAWISISDSNFNKEPGAVGSDLYWDQMARKGTDGTQGSDGTDGEDGIDATAPTGCVMMFAGGDSDLPAGWLFCRGQELSTSTYSDLHDVIGSTYGSGSGVFNVPDLRARLPVGRSVAGTGGPDDAAHAVQTWCNSLTDRSADTALDGEVTLAKGQIPELDTSIAVPHSWGGDSSKWEIQTRAASGPQFGTDQYYDDLTPDLDPWIKAGDPSPDNVDIKQPYIVLDYIIKT